LRDFATKSLPCIFPRNLNFKFAKLLASCSDDAFNSRNTAPARSTTRDKVSNGRLLKNVDLRSSSARRFRDLVRTYEAELGGEL
jgi:hypothetical protein